MARACEELSSRVTVVRTVLEPKGPEYCRLEDNERARLLSSGAPGRRPLGAS
jgi:hypothetical protein